MIERTGRRIGVAVCTYRRPEPLRACLRALAAAELGPLGTCDIALIVVDNAADGSAQVVCREAGLTPPWTLHLIEERRRGIPFARNRALTEGLRLGVDLVALIDDDDLPRPDWLHLLVARQAATGADVVFGRWEPARSIVPPPGLGSMLLKKLRRPDGVVDRFGLPQDASTNNALLTRRLIESMAATSELFSPEFAHTGGSDHDFFIRCHRQGFRLERCPESVVEGVGTKRMTLGGLLKRSFNLGPSKQCLNVASCRHTS